MNENPHENPQNLFDKIGRPGVKLGDLQEIQIDFLEEMCKLWPFTLERWHALREHNAYLLPEIAEREKPYIKKSQQYLTALWYLRLKLEERVSLAGADYQQKILTRCKNDISFFVNYWCWCYDPRLPEIGLSAKIPFILYPAQERIIKHIELCYRTRQSCLIDKSREAGISWGVCALLTHHWLFVPGFSAILGSEKEEKVDMLGSTQPLMGKLRYIIYNLPVWMRPEAYRQELPSKAYDNYRRIVNPENGSEIKGEAGINIGRSGRASMVVIDESQDLSHPDAVDEALESVMNCRVDIGTPKGMNHFGQKRWSGQVLVESIHWYEDPRKNPKWREPGENPEAAWFKYKELTVAPVVLAQEYLLDYQSSVEGLAIQPEWVRAAVGFNLPAQGTKSAGFDVAGSGKNKSIYIMRIGPVVSMPNIMPFDTSTEAMWAAINLAESDGVDSFAYDADGIGESIWGQLKISGRKLRFLINAVHGAGKPSELYLEDEGKYAYEKYQNKRAELWFQVRERFRRTYEHRNGVKSYSADMLISIPDDPILINQLCSPKIVVSSQGRYGIESKKDMKRRGIESPDYADALVYCIGDYKGEGYVLENFDYRKDEQFDDFTINWERAAGEKFISIVHGENMQACGICGLYNYSSKKLQVFAEFDISNALPETVISEVYAVSGTGMTISEWTANDEIFRDIDKSTKTVWHQYRKAGIKLKRSYEYDEAGSILLANTMFKYDKLQIHSTNCKRTFAQLREWRTRGGRPEKNLMFARAFSQMIVRMKRKKLLSLHPVKGVKEYGKFRKPDFAEGIEALTRV